MKYIPLKIKIVRGPNGLVYPNGHDGMEIDQYGISMHYSQEDFDVDGFKYAVTALPEDRANAYLARAGGMVEVITGVEAEAWFASNKPEPDQIVNVEVLQAIKLKQDLGIALTQYDNDALDPNSNVPGVKTNLRKGFAAKLPDDGTL